MSNPEIRFIANDDFDSACEEDFDQVDIELYAQEEGRTVPGDRSEVAATFLQAIEECRILTFEGEQFLFKRLNFLRFRAQALQVTLQGKKRPRKVIREIDRLLTAAAETREEIARANLRLVASIVRKLSSSADEFDEFVGEANIILLNAIDKFNFARGYRFSTYATHAIQRHLYRHSGKTNKRKGHETSATDSVSAAADETLEPDEPTQADVLAAADAVMARIDAVLDQRERTIIMARFGLNDSSRTSSLRELGEQLGLSKERVRQLQQQALEKLAEVAKPFESIFAPQR